MCWFSPIKSVGALIGSAVKNGARMIKSERLCKFWKIARSRTEKMKISLMTDEIANSEKVVTQVWLTGLKNRECHLLK